MSRYDVQGEDEFEPGSKGRVLKNLHGIKDPREAEALESQLLAEAIVWSLGTLTADSTLTEQHLREMHAQWLGSLYPWAGSFRTVVISRDGFVFCHPEYIEREMRSMSTGLLGASTPCRGDLPSVASQIARIHAELILIHPFREGNGRLGRWLADLMALQAGWSAPAYELDTFEKRKYYHSALRQAFAGEFTSLVELFERWLRSA